MYTLVFTQPYLFLKRCRQLSFVICIWFGKRWSVYIYCFTTVYDLLLRTKSRKSLLFAIKSFFFLTFYIFFKKWKVSSKTYDSTIEGYIYNEGESICNSNKVIS